MPDKLMCSRCAQGRHDQCKTTVWNPLDGGHRDPCSCPLRHVTGHP
jgi:hypothetical protein